MDFVRKRSLEKANMRRQELREAGKAKPLEHNLIKKAQADPVSKVKAIAAFCYHCFGGTEDEQPDHGYREQIETCTAPTCPLYPHRPRSKRGAS